MDILTWAQNQIGNNGSHYQQTCGLGSKDPWCAAWITTGLIECGELGVVSGNKFTCASEYRGGSNSFQGYFKNHGQYHTANSGYTPQPGDIVCWGSGTGAMGSHVGVVEFVDPDGTVHTIEGNRTKDGKEQVIRDSYTPGTSAYAKISGFGVPEYASPPVGGGNYTGNGSAAGGDYGGAAGDPGYTGGNSLGIGQYQYEEYEIQEGDDLQTIADKFGISLADLLAANPEYNRWDELEPGKTLKIPSLGTQIDNYWEAGSSAISREHTMSKKVYHPVIKVEFYTEGGALAVTTEGMDQRVYGDKDMDFDIISVSTQRSMAADCASMSITLTNRRDWYNILSSNDLVIVKMQRPELGEDADLHEELQEVFIGVIDDIRKSLDFSSGQPKRAVQVTARNMAKAFVNFNVGIIKNITIDTTNGFMGDALFDLVTLNSADAIQKVWNKFVGSAIRYQFYSGSLEDYIAYQSKPHKFEFLADYASLSQYTGSLWNFIKELSNPPFNETFWEVRQVEDEQGGRRSKEVLIHRPCPFDPEDWKELENSRITIRDDDIVTDATGRSDLETYTVYIVNLRSLGSSIDNFYNPLWYPPYYAKYGISQLEVTSTYETQEWQGNNVDDTEAMKQYTLELFNWNIKNNVFANGQIVVKGRASYKVGQTVILEYNGLEFYVEGVAHNFTVYGSWTTTLSVTRGITPTERFSAPWGMGTEMTTDAMQMIQGVPSGGAMDITAVGDGGVFTVGGGGNYDGGGSMGGVAGGGAGIGGSSASGGGSTINVPADLQQCGIIPDDVTTDYNKRSWSYNQKKVFDLWKNQGGASSGGIATLNGRYLIAMREGTIGSAGDMVDVYLENGSVIHAILADEKGNDCGNAWGHKQEYFGSGGVHTVGISLVEFERVSGNNVSSQVLAELIRNGWYLQKVVKVENLGSMIARSNSGVDPHTYAKRRTQ